MHARTFAFAAMRRGAVCRYTGETSREGLVEDRAIGFFLDNCGGERLAHPRALDPGGGNGPHRVERFGHREDRRCAARR